jgi:hypothetical protein
MGLAGYCPRLPDGPFGVMLSTDGDRELKKRFQTRKWHVNRCKPLHPCGLRAKVAKMANFGWQQDARFGISPALLMVN